MLNLLTVIKKMKISESSNKTILAIKKFLNAKIKKETCIGHIMKMNLIKIKIEHINIIQTFTI